MRTKLIITSLIMCLLLIGGYISSKYTKMPYREGDFKYLIDANYTNKKLPKEMPALAKLKYIYIHERRSGKDIVILLNHKNRMLYLGKDIDRLMNSDLCISIALDNEETDCFLETITDYDLQPWKTYKLSPIVSKYNGYWQTSLEFENDIIYYYQGMESKDFDEFFLSWYLLIEKFKPDVFENREYNLNTRVYDVYKRQLKP